MSRYGVTGPQWVKQSELCEHRHVWCMTHRNEVLSARTSTLSRRMRTNRSGIHACFKWNAEFIFVLIEQLYDELLEVYLSRDKIPIACMKFVDSICGNYHWNKGKNTNLSISMCFLWYHCHVIDFIASCKIVIKHLHVALHLISEWLLFQSVVQYTWQWYLSSQETIFTLTVFMLA